MNTEKTIKPFHIDGLLYFGIAFFGVISAALGSDEAFNLMSPALLFWIKTSVNSLGAGFLALKTFRSTSYADQINSPTVPENKYEVTPKTIVPQPPAPVAQIPTP